LLELRQKTMLAHQLASGLEPSELEQKQRVAYRFECAQIIMLEGQSIGLMKLARDASEWQLIQIQLEPALQGQGIGGALLAAVIAEAKHAGVTLRLDVLRANPARRLYERLGFSRVNEGPHEYEMRLLPT
jgi:ribosomal protein S18 acetylase RimI-like enzyme